MTNGHETKSCLTCGHLKSWHDTGKRCFGNPKVKGLCSARCQKFKPEPKPHPHVGSIDDDCKKCGYSVYMRWHYTDGFSNTSVGKAING